MFGKIAEGGLDNELNGGRGELLAEMMAPGLGRGFPGGKDDFSRGMGRRAQEMWGGEFNDAPDAAGAEMVMEDDELEWGQVHYLEVAVRLTSGEPMPSRGM